MKVFNINNYVKVKLTQDAVEELKRQHNELYSKIGKYKRFTLPKVDDDGYSKFQMWDLMNSLGHMCCLGFNSPFEGCDMLICEDDLYEYGGCDEQTTNTFSD